MFDNIASIDIGSSSIKLIKAKRGFKKFEIISVVDEAIDLDASNSNYIAALDTSINNILERENLTGFNTIISIPTDYVILRNITFPFNDIKQITNAVPFEAEDSIPYPIDMVEFDFQTIPTEDANKSDVILAAVKKDFVDEITKNFMKHELTLTFAGLESNALLRCYEYFNSVNEETILEVDIGKNKTLVNIVRNTSIIYTRGISIGIGNIIEKTAKILNVSLNRAQSIIESLDIDLSSFELNLKKDNFKNLSLSKNKLKQIFQEAEQIVKEIVSEITFTIKASRDYSSYSQFSRIIITGGGSNIKGLSKIISDESGLPVVFMPFLEEYIDPNIRSRFSICFGNILVYMNNRRESINFLKNEQTSQLDIGLIKKYSLPIFFVSLTILFLIIYIITTIFFVVRSNNYTDGILKVKFEKYFNQKSNTTDPLQEAKEILKKEKKDLSLLTDMLGAKNLFMPAINLIISQFNGAEGFYVKKIEYNGKSIIVSGELKKLNDLEEFKKKLLDTGEFDKIEIKDTNTTSSRSTFTLSINQKI